MNVTLILFTCQGKEHLLPACFSSFKKSCNYSFSKIILAVDGQINPAVITQISPDILVQNHVRKGYIYNILNALALVDTDYFFWLEDDFDFKQDINLNFMLEHMEKNPDWAEIILSRHAPLKKEEIEMEIYKPFYQLEFGFSASPVLCRTSFLKYGFDLMKKAPKNDSTKLVAFENFLTDVFRSHNYKCALLDPGNIPHLEHIGILESTAREYIMINSLDSTQSDIGKDYISGLGYDRNISLWNKIKMILKLCIAFPKLAIKQFGSRKIYDYAFRLTQASSNNFKY